MKIHSTNYKNTFIVVADDCPVTEAQVPPIKGNKQTVANIQFDFLIKHPYHYTSDDVIFEVFAIKNEIIKSNYKGAREDFFSKGQACMRCSPLTKRYGWGVHCNEEQKIALIPFGTKEYNEHLNDKKLTIVKAMKSKK